MITTKIGGQADSYTTAYGGAPRRGATINPRRQRRRTFLHLGEFESDCLSMITTKNVLGAQNYTSSMRKNDILYQ